LNYCQLPVDALAALFAALSTKTAPATHLLVYDNAELQVADREHLLEIILQVQNVRDLHVNLDFTDESVLSSFRRNSSICNLHTYDTARRRHEVASGPVVDTLKRNRCLYEATVLLGNKPRGSVPMSLCSRAIDRLSDDNTGATAVYKILQEKLVMWCAPHHDASTVRSVTPAAARTSSTLPSVASVSSISTGTDTGLPMENDTVEASTTTTVCFSSTKDCNDKRSYAQATAGDNNDDEETLQKKQACTKSTQSERN
jgi:hypothetical protein